MDFLASNLPAFQMHYPMDTHCSLSPLFKLDDFSFELFGCLSLKSKYNVIPFGNREDKELYWYCFGLILLIC